MSRPQANRPVTGAKYFSTPKGYPAPEANKIYYVLYYDNFFELTVSRGGSDMAFDPGEWIFEIMEAGIFNCRRTSLKWQEYYFFRF